MKDLKYIFLLITLTIILLSCKKDDVEEVFATDDYIVTVDGNELKENDIWETSAINEDGNMKLVFKNLSSSKINLRMKIVSIEGVVPPMGTIQFCMGECYTSVASNVSYPLDSQVEGSSNVYSLDAGISSPSNLNHIQCTEDRNESFKLNIKIYQADDNGNELTSKKMVPFTFSFVKP